jgi:hypothetical protein
LFIQLYVRVNILLHVENSFIWPHNFTKRVAWAYTYNWMNKILTLTYNWMNKILTLTYNWMNKILTVSHMWGLIFCSSSYMWGLIFCSSSYIWGLIFYCMWKTVLYDHIISQDIILLYTCSQRCFIICLSNLLILSEHDKGFFKNASCALN